MPPGEDPRLQTGRAHFTRSNLAFVPLGSECNLRFSCQEDLKMNKILALSVAAMVIAGCTTTEKDRRRPAKGRRCS